MAEQDTAQVVDKKETQPERLTIQEAIAQRSREEAAPKVSMGPDGLPETFSEEDLLMLSDAEREAIMADEDIQPRVTQEDEDENDDESDGDGDGGGVPEAKKEDPAKEPPAREFQPEEVPDVSEARAKLEAAESKYDDLVEKFDDGELTKDEFQAQTKDILKQITGYQTEISRADQVAERNRTTVAERWYAAVGDYTKDRAALMDENGPLLPLWDKELRAVNSDPATSQLPVDRRLALAHERVLATAKFQGIEIPKDMAPPPGSQKKAQQKQQIEPRTDERDDIPPTVAHMPQTDTNATDESRFTQIDRVIDQDPHLAEQAASRLSDEEMERFLRGE